MSARTFVFGVVLVFPALALCGQTREPNTPQATVQKDAADTDMQPADPAQQKASRTFAAKGKVSPPVAKPAVLTPLNPRERALQLLDRFTFGPRPGEVDRVLATGADNWLEQQLNPDTIKNDALNKRLNEFPTIDHCLY